MELVSEAASFRISWREKIQRTKPIKQLTTYAGQEFLILLSGRIWLAELVSDQSVKEGGRS